MDSKFLALLIFGIVVICHNAAALPAIYKPIYFSSDGLEDVDTLVYDNVAEPVSVVKREAPVYNSKDHKKDKDLEAAATGYGGHGGYAPTSYVSYGAKTGGYGAFSWYSDHPVGGGYGYH